MSLAPPLSPPIDADVEYETLGFDYGYVLVDGETISAVDSMTCTVVSGTDVSPQDRLIGMPQIAAALSTGAPNSRVLQMIGGCLAGVTYEIQCVARTTDGQRLSLRTEAQCVGTP